MNSPVVSVVMPVYNGEDYLEETIRSVLEQSFEDFEFILVDDHSTDGSLDILREWAAKDERIVLTRTERNLGISGATNAGFDLVRGRYVAMHDQDDISLPQRFEMQVKALESDPELGILGTSFALVDAESQVQKVVTPPLSDAAIREWILFSSPFCSPSVMLRSALLEDERLDPDFDLTQDYHLYSRIYTKCGVSNLPDVLMHYRIHQSQNTTKSFDEQQRRAGLVAKRLISVLGGDWIEEAQDKDVKLMRFMYLEPKQEVEKAFQMRALALLKRTLDLLGDLQLKALEDKLARCPSLTPVKVWGEPLARDLQFQDYPLLNGDQPALGVDIPDKVRISKLFFTRVALMVYAHPGFDSYEFSGGDEAGLTRHLGEAVIRVRRKRFGLRKKSVRLKLQ